MIVSDSYLAGTSSEDWAIITLKNNLGTKTGWLGLHWQSSNCHHHSWCMLMAIRA